MTHATEPGVVMGTAGYVSPEQVRGRPVDHLADIFAFGAILYEMLSGRLAFQRSTSADTMAAILNKNPPGISQIVQSTPTGLQWVVHRCWGKNPEQRFQSASDLAFALEALSESEISSGTANHCAGPPHARPPPTLFAIRRTLLRVVWWLLLLHLAEIALWALFNRWRGYLPNARRIRGQMGADISSAAVAGLCPMRISPAVLFAGCCSRAGLSPGQFA